MELRFEAKLSSNSGNEYYDAGHIKFSRGSNTVRVIIGSRRCFRYFTEMLVLENKQNTKVYLDQHH